MCLQSLMNSQVPAQVLLTVSQLRPVVALSVVRQLIHSYRGLCFEQKVVFNVWVCSLRKLPCTPDLLLQTV